MRDYLYTDSAANLQCPQMVLVFLYDNIYIVYEN